MTATTTAAPVRVALLHTEYPCCGQRSRFPVEAASYLRRCPVCQAKWRVLRTTSAPSNFSVRLGVRFDVLKWERRP